MSEYQGMIYDLVVVMQSLISVYIVIFIVPLTPYEEQQKLCTSVVV